MRVRYKIPFKSEVIFPDHWDIPLQGGVCRVIEEAGRAKALEVEFVGQPLSRAPRLEKTLGDLAHFSITDRDHQMPFVLRQLEDAMTFLQCYFNIDLMTNEAEAIYEGETPEEEALIPVKSLGVGDYLPPLNLKFDMLTRAIMAAEKSRGPKFEATLVAAARRSLEGKEWINSFRYSFLLIESLYGDGQFKSASLKSALKNNDAFVSILREVLEAYPKLNPGDVSDTAALLLTRPTPFDVIDHLVDKRGFYFHGNTKRKDAWKPHEQDAAKELAFLAIGISHSIAEQSAAPLFEEIHNRRHYEDAIKVGAEIVYQINFEYRQDDESFLRKGQLDVSTPGTKVAARSAQEIAQHFLRDFEVRLPTAVLRSATCIAPKTGQKVFDIHFHIGTEAEDG